jgi:hypothetical protein
MTRTLGETLRRRNLSDAASGFPARAAVVLYACIPPGQTRGDVVPRLRRYAEARDWDVAATVVDYTPTATPLERRPNWPQARDAISSGRARGIVTTSRLACGETTGTPVLSQWLDTHNAETTPTATEEAV